MACLFITGAGSGIGRALTERALARGDQVIAGAFSDEERSGFPSRPELFVVKIDVGVTASVDGAFAEADLWLAGRRLDAVINCAGICPLGAVEVQDIDVIERTLNVNAVGSARILRAALPRLRGNGGRLVLVSSLWGKVGGPMLSAYCASKHAIEAMADAARRETHGHDTHIIVVEPGAVRTALVAGQVAGAHKAAANLTPEFQPLYQGIYKKYAAMIDSKSSGGISAEACAAVIERAVFDRKPKTRYRAGADAKIISLLARLLPDTMLDGAFKAMLK